MNPLKEVTLPSSFDVAVVADALALEVSQIYNSIPFVAPCGQMRAR